MKKICAFVFWVLPFTLTSLNAYCWGFYGHQQLNRIAVFLLPPPMLVLFKPQIDFLTNHAVDPDKRRYAIPEEGPRHYIDMDHYGTYPFAQLPHHWKEAVDKYSADTLQAHGIVPWHIQTMLYRLTEAFRKKDFSSILKNAAELGHYIGDAHVPLHTSSNHNGQLTNQRGVHGFWESRVPELLADKEFDFYIGKAAYISQPDVFIWNRILESAQSVDSVLLLEKKLTAQFPADKKYAFEERNGQLVRQYSSAFTVAYNRALNGMIERRMRQAIFAIASFWYTAWMDAGQPDLQSIAHQQFSPEELQRIESLHNAWNVGAQILGREE
jgi:hypothetical protein